MGQRGVTVQGRRRRRQSAPLAVVGLVLATVVVGGGVAIASWRGVGGTGADAAPGASAPAPGTGAQVAPDSPPVSASPSVEAAVTPSPTPTPTPTPTTVPVSGPGTFTAAEAQGKKTGTGPLRRYLVEVEDGIDISAEGAAAEIQEILAHPLGWAAHGRGSFQLVSGGKEADFIIRIATPTTADKLCAQQGLNTRGELNCETTDGVVVNLRRWMLGSPMFDGPPTEYRHLIINHEVGHEIGIRQHMGCGGPGKLAPVMMQQIKGLDGCRSNAWPYDEDGEFIEGPLV
ncbi:DUF3152 domain-containing protein [Streptomyces sp. NPDC093109]|uniref:DUF3152 domain-containing protein n=1 Tax=Streptomyces sp. NPDC093109 TaxID=3154977 RepID=UPI0034505714